jgi:hypothetical protein
MASKTPSKPTARRSAAPIRKVAAKRLPVAKTTKVKPATKKADALASAKTKAKPIAKPAIPKIKKTKLVRDSFTIPKDEYVALQNLKERAVQLGRSVKKGELLRAGLLALSTMSDAAFLATLATVPALKTGRPKGAKNSKK